MRRLVNSALLLAVLCCPPLGASESLAKKRRDAPAPATTAEKGKVVRLWASGCCHVGTDLRVSGRESLADAIRQSEYGGDQGGQPFDWDIAVHLGDFSGNQGPGSVPYDAERAARSTCTSMRVSQRSRRTVPSDPRPDQIQRRCFHPTSALHRCHRWPRPCRPPSSRISCDVRECTDR